MGDYGLKISRTGAAITSSNLSDYVIHSKYKSLKSQARATSTMTLTAGSFTMTPKTIAHGLGYAPLFFVAAELNTDKWYNLGATSSVPIDSKPGFAYLVSAHTDATNLEIRLSTGETFASDQTYNLSYFIIIDQIV